MFEIGSGWTAAGAGAALSAPGKCAEPAPAASGDSVLAKTFRPRLGLRRLRFGAGCAAAAA